MNETAPLKRGIVAALHDTEETIREAIVEIESLVKGEIAQDAKIDRLRAANEHDWQLHGKLQSRIGSLLDENSRLVDENSRLALTVDGLQAEARRVLIVEDDKHARRAQHQGHSAAWAEADLVITTKGRILKSKFGPVSDADTQRLRAESALKVLGKAQEAILNISGWIRNGKSETATKHIDEIRADGWSKIGWKQHLEAYELKPAPVIDRSGETDGEFAEVDAAPPSIALGDDPERTIGVSPEEWKRHKAKMATPERGDLVEVVSFAWKGRIGSVTDAEGDFRTVTFSSGGKCLFHARDLKVIEKTRRLAPRATIRP